MTNSLTEQQTQDLIDGFRLRAKGLSWWQVAVMNLSYPIWRPVLSTLISYLYENSVLDSSRFHLIAAFFDRTQKDAILYVNKKKRA